VLQREFGFFVMPGKSYKEQAIADLSEATLFRLDRGASSTTLLLEPRLTTAGIVEVDRLQDMLTTLFTEDEWSNEQVLMFEGAEAAQTHIHEFRKTVSFEHRNLAVAYYSVRKRIASRHQESGLG